MHAPFDALHALFDAMHVPFDAMHVPFDVLVGGIRFILLRAVDPLVLAIFSCTPSIKGYRFFLLHAIDPGLSLFSLARH